MRQVLNGYGQDTTAATFSHLTGGDQFPLANLYLIGAPENPQSFWLTDWESPLWWPVWGNSAFKPTTITRGTVTSKVGLESPKLDITWSPANQSYSASVVSANVWQLAQQGYYDNWPVRVWSAYLDANGGLYTYGCSTLFGANIGNTSITRKGIVFSVNSFLYPTGQQVPTNVIELLNTVAAYTGASPPAGFTSIPQFNVIGGDSNTLVIGDGTTGAGGAHHVYSDNAFQHGYIVFNDGPGATLAGVWSAIQQNTSVTISGTPYNEFVLYAPLPWPPTPFLAGSGDTFYVSAAAPINQSDGEYFGFPYVPNPEMAI